MNVRDNTGRILNHRFNDFSFAISRLVYVEYRKNGGQGYKQRCIRKLLSWTDTSSKSEDNVVRIVLRFVTNETLWLEFYWVLISTRVMCKPPSSVEMYMSAVY